VDIESTQDIDGTYNVAYILQGEWLEYTINVPVSGKYDLNARVAADGDGKLFHIEMDGTDVTGPVNVPNTGGWQTWQTVSIKDINLTAGEHVMRIAFDASYMNLNYIEFSDVITGLENNKSESVDLYPNPFSESGLHIKRKGDFEYSITDSKGTLIEKGQGTEEQHIGQNLVPGIYFLFLNQAGSQNVMRISRQ
jgi:hypothetical protein